MLKVEPNEKYAKHIRKAILDFYRADQRRPSSKWHVYDLLFPRATVGRRLFGDEPTPEDIGFFFLGKAIHEHIQKILGIDKAEVPGEKWGILSTIDYLGEDALEIKSSRKWTVPESPEPHYVRQAGYYACIYELEQITILVIYPTSGRTWKGKKSSTVEIKAWTLYTPLKVRKQIIYDLLRTKEELEYAINTKKVKDLPPAPEWTVERFEGKIDGGDYKSIEKDMRKHPFFYAYTEKGWL